MRACRSNAQGSNTGIRTFLSAWSIFVQNTDSLASEPDGILVPHDDFIWFETISLIRPSSFTEYCLPHQLNSTVEQTTRTLARFGSLMLTNDESLLSAFNCLWTKGFTEFSNSVKAL